MSGKMLIQVAAITVGTVFIVNNVLPANVSSFFK